MINLNPISILKDWQNNIPNTVEIIIILYIVPFIILNLVKMLMLRLSLL